MNVQLLRCSPRQERGARPSTHPREVFVADHMLECFGQLLIRQLLQSRRGEVHRLEIRRGGEDHGTGARVCPVGHIRSPSLPLIWGGKNKTMHARIFLSGADNSKLQLDILRSCHYSKIQLWSAS